MAEILKANNTPMSIDDAIKYVEAVASYKAYMPPIREALQMAANALYTLEHIRKPCYKPDGNDGCSYMCYDGQDEPIDECKECPLCYTDKQRHSKEKK